jgi:hypothetical protein
MTPGSDKLSGHPGQAAQEERIAMAAPADRRGQLVPSAGLGVPVRDQQHKAAGRGGCALGPGAMKERRACRNSFGMKVSVTSLDGPASASHL